MQPLVTWRSENRGVGGRKKDGFCEVEINPGPSPGPRPLLRSGNCAAPGRPGRGGTRGGGGCGHISEHPHKHREGEHGQTLTFAPVLWSEALEILVYQCACCQSHTPSGAPVPKVSAAWSGRPLPGAWSGQDEPPRTSHTVSPWEKPTIRAPRRRPGAASDAGTCRLHCGCSDEGVRWQKPGTVHALLPAPSPVPLCANNLRSIRNPVTIKTALPMADGFQS